jgi:hypothetical protein
MARGVAGVARDVDFLLQLTCTVRVAAALGLSDICQEGAEALEPYAGRGVLNAGAVAFHGVVDEYLYAAHQALGHADAAGWRQAAESAYLRIGASWWERQLGAGRTASAPARPARRVHLRQDGSGLWSLGDDGSTFELADLKGLHYVRYLVERPAADIDALTRGSDGREVRLSATRVRGLDAGQLRELTAGLAGDQGRTATPSPRGEDSR